MCTALFVETAVWENNCDTSVNDLCGDKQGEQTVSGRYYQSTTVRARAFIVRVHLESLKLITRIVASLFCLEGLDTKKVVMTKISHKRKEESIKKNSSRVHDT